VSILELGVVRTHLVFTPIRLMIIVLFGFL